MLTMNVPHSEEECTQTVPHFKFEKPHLKFKKWQPCQYTTF